MHPVVTLALCAAWPEPTPGEMPYVTALREAGFDLRVGLWNGDQSAFHGVDLVVLRGTWDYHRDLAAYRDWLAGLAEAGVAVANPVPLVLWNLDKAYLIELASRGIALPDQAILPLDLPAAQALLAAKGWQKAVAKPTAGGSGHGVTLVTPETLASLWPEIAAAVTPHRLLLQEFVPEIASGGQVSFIFYNGVFSHAAQLVPQAGEFRINSKFQPIRQAFHPSPDVLAQARAVLAALPGAEQGAPLYARIDGIFRGMQFVLLEAEVNEPGLFLDLDPQAGQRFAAATLHWVEKAKTQKVSV
ncbi:MAG: hypothetical protein KJ904_06325 [Alphaproteobacteria bacterium]|nr:hypothetical protein [Alphaproteobacteria bacterium]MBU0796411.1 hypothetical protein [Alphaproteobacteria bacterium]MBU0886762.1 hypothetical protein [Alphaproteobacteria bacterium]MBU1812625.1 hypothetical protein [Alphaproteobacteria bacterium]MBU2089045.1 hypothetical protein [Alphaproteobacteria bacterium]